MVPCSNRQQFTIFHHTSPYFIFHRLFGRCLAGQTALHMACACGALPLVSALLKAGANPNLCDRTGASCVAMAASAGHTHVLQKLLRFA